MGIELRATVTQTFEAADDIHKVHVRADGHLHITRLKGDGTGAHETALTIDADTFKTISQFIEHTLVTLRTTAHDLGADNLHGAA
jgi:hypothetical protein